MAYEILTIREVAELIKLNENTAYKLASAGKIPGFKVGGSWRFERQGHDIPEPVIRRRFAMGWNNFQRRYRQAVDDWALYDNAGAEPAMPEWGENQ